MWLACPTVTIAPLLEAMVAPENSFLTPSVEQETSKRLDIMLLRALPDFTCCRHTFSGNSEEPIKGVFIAGNKHFNV